MNLRSSRPVVILRAMAAETTESHLTLMAGSLAFYAFLSLIPLFILSFVAASVVGGEAFARLVTDLFKSILTGSAREVLANVLTDPSGQTGASALGLLTLLWSALKFFRGLDIAFDAVYGIHKAKSILKQLRDAIIVLVAVGLAVGTIVLIGGVLAVVPILPTVEQFGTPLLIVGLSVTFLPLYYFVPDANVSVREVVPGSVVAALGWALTMFSTSQYSSADCF